MSRAQVDSRKRRTRPIQLYFCGLLTSLLALPAVSMLPGCSLFAGSTTRRSASRGHRGGGGGGGGGAGGGGGGGGVAAAAPAGDCNAAFAAIKQQFDQGMAELRSAPITQRGLEKKRRLHLDRMIGRAERTPGCKEASKPFAAKLREISYTFRLDLAGKALAAGKPLKARFFLWKEYNRQDRVMKPAYRDLSRKIAAAYDAMKLKKFTETGALGQNAPGRTMCVFSSKPFPAKPTVAPIFSSHVEGDRLYVLCRLPKAAASYEKGITPRFTMHLGKKSGRAMFSIASRKLGSPAAHGSARYLRADFPLPPERSDFAEVKRHGFDVWVKLFWKFKKRTPIGYVIRGAYIFPAQSLVFWHRP